MLPRLDTRGRRTLRTPSARHCRRAMNVELEVDYGTFLLVMETKESLNDNIKMLNYERVYFPLACFWYLHV